MDRCIIILKRESKGIFNDALILSNILKKYCSFDTNIVYKKDIENYSKKYYKVKIFIENIVTDAITLIKSEYSLFLPNIEQLEEWDIKNLKYIDYVLCKTKISFHFFEKYKVKKVYTRFTSISSHDDTIKKDYNLYGHFAGTSPYKGTLPLLKMWIKYYSDNENIKLYFIKKISKWSNLDQDLSKYLDSIQFKNIDDHKEYKNIIWYDYLEYEEFTKLKSKVGIHLCPSITEGYGHYINEAREMKSIIFTTDAPPMNELITNKDYLIKVKSSEKINSVLNRKYLLKSDLKVYFFDEDDLKNKIDTLVINDEGTVNNNNYYNDTSFFYTKIISFFSFLKKRNIDYYFNKFIYSNQKILSNLYKISNLNNSSIIVKLTDLIFKLFNKYNINHIDKKIINNKIKIITTNDFDLKKETNYYEVGDNYTEYPYSYKYNFYVAKNDLIIQDYFKKGYLYEIYNTMILNSFLKKDDIVLDIGANVGTMTVPLSKIVNSGKVYSFEPFNKTFEILKENVKINNCDNVILYNNSVGHTNIFTFLSNTTLDLKNYYYEKKKVNKKASIISLENKNKIINYGSIQLGLNGQLTKMISVDSLNLKRVDCIKIDVEGAENLVFLGALETIKKFKPIIIFEYNWQKLSDSIIKTFDLSDNQVNFNILDFLKKNGYTKIIESNLEDFIIMTPGHERIIEDKLIKFKKVNKLKISNTDGFSLFKLMKIKWI